jgi:hypothetical protein
MDITPTLTLPPWRLCHKGGEGANGWFRNSQNWGSLDVRLTSRIFHRRTCMGYRRTELLVKRFPSGISSTTHLPPLYLVCSQYEILVLSEFGDCDTASKGEREQ